MRRWAIAGLVAMAAVGGGCGNDDGGGDVATFCAQYRALADNSPFDPIETASPNDMRAAFDILREAADAIDDAVPDEFDELDRLAGTYRGTVVAVHDVLAAADFDPRDVDGAAYRRATLDYGDAATALSNEARTHC